MWRTPCSPPSRAPRGPCVVPSQRQRQRQHRVYHASASGEGGETRTPGRAQVDGDALRERIYIEQPEAGGVTPAPPPVAHSAAFIQKRRGLWATNAAGESDGTTRAVRRKSGIEVAVDSLDDKLSAVEGSPPRVAEVFSDALSSKTGRAIRSGVADAAKGTLDAGLFAAKKTVPILGWAVAKGAEAILREAKPKGGSPKRK